MTTSRPTGSTTIAGHENEQIPRPRARAPMDSGWREVADTVLAFVRRFA